MGKDVYREPTEGLTFNVDYGTHKYTETWVKSDYFCPKCSNQGVFVESGPGDCDVGPKHICVSCAYDFYIPDGFTIKPDNKEDSQRLENLRHPETAKDIEIRWDRPSDPLLAKTYDLFQAMRMRSTLLDVRKLPPSEGRTIKWRRYEHSLLEQTDGVNTRGKLQR